MYLVITRLLGRSEKKVLVTAVGEFEEWCTWSICCCCCIDLSFNNSIETDSWCSNYERSVLYSYGTYCVVLSHDELVDKNNQ